MADDCLLALVREPPYLFGFPELEKDYGHHQGESASHDVHQIAVPVIGPDELHGAKGATHHQYGWRYLKGLLPTHHGAYQPKWHDNASYGQDASNHGIQVGLRRIIPYYRSQRVHGCANGSPSHRCSVGNQI